MRLSTLLCAFLAVPALVVVTTVPTAAEAADGNAILAAVDKRAEVFTDQSYTATMKIHRDGKLGKTLVFELAMKGLEKQYIEFTSPGDVAGMKVLMDSRDSLWIYSPEFKKVRKVAAHAQNQGFLGSEFTPEDMVMAKLSPGYDAEVEGKSGNETTMTLTPKPGAASSYAKLQIVIDSTKGGITVIRYYDGAGGLVREQRREEWVKIGGHLMPTRIVMDNKKNGNTTVIDLSNVRVNQGIDDSVFSRRNLLRG